ncbi:MAG: hypothetical protein ACTHNU_12910 [Gaiellales bacterium]
MKLHRLESLPAGEAAAVAGLGLVAAGLAVVADALVEAAPSSTLGTADRLVYGLWTVRLEHGLVFTVGLGLTLWGVARGASLRGWREPVLRLTAGLAYGLAALAVAVLAASTYLALRGHVGSGFVEVQVTGRARGFTWLRQAVTACGFGIAWTLAGAQLGRLARQPIAELEEEAEETPPRPVPPPQPVPAALAPAVAPTPAESAHIRREPPTPVVTGPATEPMAATLSGRARHTYRERLAYSPRGPQARELADQIEQLERAGKTDEAARLLARLEAL